MLEHTPAACEKSSIDELQMVSVRLVNLELASPEEWDCRNLTFAGSAGIVVSVSTDNSSPLGEWLRQRREELDISLEQAEADTRIRLRYLEALESGEYDALPDPVVGRGFLRNYAAYLDLDPLEAADRFSRKVAPPEPESLSVEGPTPFTAGVFRPLSLHEMPARRSRWIWVAGLALILVAALAVLGWWGYPYLSGWLDREDPTEPALAPTRTSLATTEDLATATRMPSVTVSITKETTGTPATSTPTPRVTRTPTRTPSPTPTPSPPVYTGIFLELVFSDTSWIQVTVDGVREFQGELEADTYRSWYGEERIELRIGNAGAVLVTVNGQSLGALGEPDEVIDRVFEKVGEGVTEATITPTPTTDETPEPTTAPTTAPTATPVEPTATGSPEPATATFTPTVSP
jgi:cytoskeleton protein RodZ